MASPLSRLSNNSRVAFFLCDIQQKFANHIFQYGAVVGTAHKMIAGANILNVPVIVTEQTPTKLGHTDASLDISKSHLFSKSQFSMLTPEVNSAMRKLHDNKGVNHVVMFGIETQVCVLQTALDLLESGIAVTIVQDGVSSCNQGEIQVALERMKQAGAFISTSESVFFQIMKDASHPGFKEIQGLLKATKESTTNALNVFCLPPSKL
ncbi:Isochorismatase domain-containing protein 1 [Podochytrium sp. JEL0797]|nr:Isochorismatase domain-containing protein 1 [Podochytrium sp. JEL0797]